MTDNFFEKILNIIKEAGKIIRCAHMESEACVTEKEGNANFVTVYDVRVQEYLKGEIKDDVITGIKNKMSMKAIEKISTTAKKEGDIKWNFTKFLVDGNGKVIERYSPTFKPEDMENEIKALLM